MIMMKMVITEMITVCTGDDDGNLDDDGRYVVMAKTVILTMHYNDNDEYHHSDGDAYTPKTLSD